MCWCRDYTKRYGKTPPDNTSLSSPLPDLQEEHRFDAASPQTWQYIIVSNNVPPCAGPWYELGAWVSEGGGRGIEVS